MRARIYRNLWGDVVVDFGKKPPKIETKCNWASSNRADPRVAEPQSQSYVTVCTRQFRRLFPNVPLLRRLSTTEDPEIREVEVSVTLIEEDS